jgi:hypothetical protein
MMEFFVCVKLIHSCTKSRLMNWNAFVKGNYEKMMQLGIDLRDLDSVRLSAGEMFRHQLIKFIICHHLTGLRHHFKTEQPIRNAICDIIDLDTFTIYEVETRSAPSVAKRKLEDFFHPLIEDILIVDLKKLKSWNNVFDLRQEVAKLCGLR